MFSFWMVAGLLLLISLFVIMLTLLKTQDDENNKTEEKADIYQQRINEIESDIENGLLSLPDAEKVKQEMQLALLNESNIEQALPASNNSDTSTLTMAVLMIVIPVFVIGLYQYLGQPQLIAQAELLSEFNNAQSNEEKMASVEKMLSQLEQRLINNPDDIDGWLMLANSYTALERYPEALKAVDNLLRLRGDDPTVMLKYADILSMVNGGVFAGKPTELINKALIIDPENPSGLWLAGLAANERGDIDGAIEYWKKLLPKLDDDSEPQQKIKEYIKLASGEIDINASDSNDKINSDIALNVSVTLSEELTEQVKASDTIFIYAKALEGPPMPLSIVRKQVSDLPLQVILSDSSAMMPNNKLSDHKSVQVVARISTSGDAIPQTGDLIGSIESINTNTKENIQININNKIP